MKVFVERERASVLVVWRVGGGSRAHSEPISYNRFDGKLPVRNRLETGGASNRQSVRRRK
jgi:hypothetical protein